MRVAVFVARIALGFLLLGSISLHAEDWPMYGRDLRHSFSNPQSAITPSNVSKLIPAWFFKTDDAVSASPTVVDGVVYVGSWDGYFYAIRAQPGPLKRLKWKFPVDCQNSKVVLPWPPRCVPAGAQPPPRLTTDGGLITSSAAVADNIPTPRGLKRIVYFGAGRTLYALYADTGQPLWKQVICGNPENCDPKDPKGDPTRIFSSPALFGGLVFVGHSVDQVSGYRGGFEALDAATGKILWRFELDPDSQGGGFNRGCGNVWSSAAIDETAQPPLVFFGTSDCDDAAPPPYHEAVIALEAGREKPTKPKWVFRRLTDPTDIHHCDFDFGATPNIIDLGTGRFLGVGGKDGTYYLLDRLTDNPAGEVIWNTNVVFGGIEGGFYGVAAFDGRHIFSATGIGDGNLFTLTGLCDPRNPRDKFIQEPSMHALNADGSILWQKSKNHSFGATSLGNGVLFSGLVGIDPITGPVKVR